MPENINSGAGERRSTHVEPERPAPVVPPLTPPAAWYPDPHEPGQHRYWDGAQWTDHTSASASARTTAAGAARPTGSEAAGSTVSGATGSTVSGATGPTVPVPATAPGSTGSAGSEATGSTVPVPATAPGSTVSGATDPTVPATASAAGSTVSGATGPTVPATATASAAGAGAKRRLPKLKWWQWALIALGGLVVLSMIVNGLSGERASTDDPPADRVAPAAEQRNAADGGDERDDASENAAAEPVVEMVEVPDLVGSTVAEARAALDALGVTLEAGDAGEDWVISAQQPEQGEHPADELELSVTAEAPEPEYTLAQQNAISKAQSYLDFSGFSRGGLIDQLEYEGFSTDEATFGADNAGADWNAEAAEKAESYLEFTSFSRQGLYDQLAFEQFTPEQIEFALAAVGY